ncbi:fimbria/pilus periplasmic chaperone [Acerihabitans sp. TG2]|uniref:fimbrial biogenesis chaperone n=1 Tax=Acerihabitans sp. TG2 TaxID=3096008 RepID=UPI002B237BE8|nr:fimbria/pilus periplasmic chaperone [Acerihabitans sp. TG2]MEA9389718.1 fimbria/pilus periplasmic chaperone [Acerihabitans sp. TG2]
MSSNIMLVRALILAVLWAIVPQVCAQSLAIVPIRQDLSSAHRSASFTLTNTSDSPALIQIRSYSWIQKGNDDSFIASDKLTVSPPFATLAPGKSQTVRLLLRSPATNGEESYRIVFDQIPDRLGNKVQLTLRFTVPVFSAGSTPGHADVQWRIERQGDNLTLVAVNRGLAHSMLTGLNATTVGGEALKLVGPGMPYILAGSERRWIINDPHHVLNTGSRVHVVNPGPRNKSDQWVNVGPNH